MKITFKQLEVFVAIAKVENTSRAAEKLYLTQSACSMALAAIEEQLGGELFDRRGKKLILNDRGKLLFPKAANILTEVQEIQDLMISTKDAIISGHLTIGASTTIGNYFLPEIIGNFANLYPETKLTLQVANTEQVIQQLLKFNIDIGIVEGRCLDSTIEVIPWKKDEMIIIASPNDPLTKKKKITREDLTNARWILREPGSGTRKHFEETMGAALTPFLELGHTEAIKKAVIKGLGISCLSKSTAMDYLNNGQLIELKTPFLKLNRNFYILLHKEKKINIILKAFIKCCN